MPGSARASGSRDVSHPTKSVARTCFGGTSAALQRLPFDLTHPRHPPATAIVDAETLRQVAVYDAETESQITELRLRLSSAETNAEAQRNLVDMAQKELSKQNDQQPSMLK